MCDQKTEALIMKLKKALWHSYHDYRSYENWQKDYAEEREALTLLIGEDNVAEFLWEVDQRMDEFSVWEKDDPEFKCPECGEGIPVWNHEECENEDCGEDWGAEARWYYYATR